MIMREKSHSALVFLNIELHGKHIKSNEVLLRFMSNYMMGKLSKRAGFSHKNTRHNCSQSLWEPLVICDGKKQSMNGNWQINISLSNIGCIMNRIRYGYFSFSSCLSERVSRFLLHNMNHDFKKTAFCERSLWPYTTMVCIRTPDITTILDTMAF